jgi:AraC-like DNA-binding protein
VSEFALPEKTEHSDAGIRWSEGNGLRFGRVAGRITSGGWRWKVSSSGSIWLWLNRDGNGLVWGKSERFILKPGMYAMTGGGEGGDWSCVRFPGPHILEIVVISRDWLRDRLGKNTGWLHPELGKWLQDGGAIAFCGLMGIWERELCDALAHAVSDAGPGRLIAEARVLEWAAVRLFRDKSGGGEGFCATLRDRDPVKRAILLLRERLDQPLDLTAIAKEVGVAPHHLSRRVSTETGSTLQRHLRRMRIGRACEALGSGKMNVTEVALEVGYQSLSHFAKAFREETGESPGKWLSRLRS